MELQTERTIKTEEVLACRTCLSTELKLVRLTDTYFQQNFFFLSGVLISSNDILPNLVCIYCFRQLEKFLEFRARCCRVQSALEKLQKESYVSTETIKKLNKTKNNVLFLTKTSVQTINLTTKSNNNKKYEIITLKGHKSDEFITDTEISVDKYLRVIIKKINKAKKKLNSNEKMNSKDDNNSTDKSDYQFLNEFKIDSDTSNDKLFDRDDDISDARDDIFDNHESLIEDIKMETQFESIDEELQYEYSLNDFDKKEKTPITLKENKSDDFNTDSESSDDEYLGDIIKNKNKAKEKLNSIEKMNSKDNKNAISDNSDYTFLNEFKIDSDTSNDKLFDKDDDISDVSDDICDNNKILSEDIKKEIRFESIDEELECEYSLNRFNKKGKTTKKELKKTATKGKLKEKRDWKTLLDPTLIAPEFKSLVTRQTYNFFTKENIEKFCNDYAVDIKMLSKEEQIKDLESRSKTRGYVKHDFKCHLCFQGFVIESGYKTHMTHHDESRGEFSCEICAFRYNTKLKMMTHQRKKHALDFVCRICGKATKNTARAIFHYNSHKGAKMSCKYCDKEFTRPATQAEHMRVAHGSIRCDICGMILSNEKGIKMHRLWKHLEVVETSCDSCKGLFYYNEALEKHREGGCSNNNKYCSLCGSAFCDQESLQSHVEEIHWNSEKIFKCTKCQKRFNSKQKLTTHLYNCKKWKSRCVEGEGTNEPSDNSPCICEVCGQSLKDKRRLKVHQQIHTDGRPYKCDICSKTFRLQVAYYVHMNTHTNVRSYKCPNCPKTFSQSGHRTTHVRIVHKNERRFVCETCDRTFSQKSNLKQHIQGVHMGIRRVRNGANVSCEPGTSKN